MKWKNPDNLSYDQMSIEQRGWNWPVDDDSIEEVLNPKDPKARAERLRILGPVVCAAHGMKLEPHEKPHWPSWMPPPMPRYTVHNGVAISCMPADTWDGNSPDYDDQIFFSQNRGRKWLFEWNGWVVFEFDPDRAISNPDGSLKKKKELIIGK